MQRPKSFKLGLMVSASALALVMMAENPVAPQWNTANPKTMRYVEAWKKLQGADN